VEEKDIRRRREDEEKGSSLLLPLQYFGSWIAKFGACGECHCKEGDVLVMWLLVWRGGSFFSSSPVLNKTFWERGQFVMGPSVVFLEKLYKKKAGEATTKE
jgi:hypothetical protein